jgi:hypothetical protein
LCILLLPGFSRPPAGSYLLRSPVKSSRALRFEVPPVREILAVGRLIRDQIDQPAVYKRALYEVGIIRIVSTKTSRSVSKPKLWMQNSYDRMARVVMMIEIGAMSCFTSAKSTSR